MADIDQVIAARERLLTAALRVISGRVGDFHPGPHDDAEAEYADEMLALAARELVKETDALPAGERPILWNREVAP